MKPHPKLPTFFLFVALVAIASFSLTGCERQTPGEREPATDPHETNEIIALAYPLQYLTQRLIGPSIDVVLLLPPGKKASHWRPQREDILRCQQATLIIANGRGAPVASWLNTVSIPDSKICMSAARGLSLSDYIVVDDLKTVHSHGPEGEHSHASTVPFTWLDPAIAEKQAVYIAGELSRVFPELADTIGSNLQGLKADLDELTGSLPSSDRLNKAFVLTANPNFKFLTRAVGATDYHLNWFAPPTPEELEAKLDEWTEKHKAEMPVAGEPPVVFLLPLDWKDGPDADGLKQAIKKRGFVPVWIDLMDSRPEGLDYLQVMQGNIERLEESLKKSN